MSSDRPPQREAATLLADETFEAWWTRERDKHMVYRAEPWTRYAARAAWDHQRAQVDRLLRVEELLVAVCGGTVEESDFESAETGACWGCGVRRAKPHADDCPVPELVAAVNGHSIHATPEKEATDGK